MNRIVVYANNMEYLYKLRKELISSLVDTHYKVHILCPYGEKVSYFVDMGCEYHEIDFSGHGKNPILELGVLMKTNKIIRSINPDLLLTFTIKPNIYGAISSRINRIPCIVNITGLGNSVQENSKIKWLVIRLYRFSFKNLQCVFFQNEYNQYFFKNNNIYKGNMKVIPGSGIVLSEYPFNEIRGECDYLYVGRLVKEKGLLEFIKAAEILKKRGIQSNFIVIGNADDENTEKIVKNNKFVEYRGYQNDVKDEMLKAKCVVLPSYHEGMANVLLEGAALGRILIASNIPGCREIIGEEVNGFLCKKQDVKSLVNAIMLLESKSLESIQEMSRQSRKKIESSFDRKIVVNEYLKEIKNIL